MKKLLVVSLSTLCAAFSGCLKTSSISGTIGVTPDNFTVAAGTTQLFQPILTGSLANSGVVWSISGIGCSANVCGTIDGNGLYKAPATVPANPLIQVVATATADKTKSGFANVTVAPPVTISITQQPASLTVAGGQQLSPFEATVTNTSNTTVNWTVTGTGCTGTGCGTITASTPNSTTPAAYTAPNVLPSPPTVTITAASAADPTKTASLDVSLTFGVVVTPNTVDVPVLQQQPFTAQVLGSANQAVNWSLSGANCGFLPTIFTCGTIDGSGTYTAPLFVPSPATVAVTATAQVDGTTSGTATVTVTPLGGNNDALLGPYAFVYRGFASPTSSPIVEAGSLVFNGHGTIQSGVEDDNNGTTAHNQRAVSGTYSFDLTDNTRGKITLTAGLVQTFRFVVVPNSNSTTAATVYLTDFSGTTVGSGKMVQQDPTKFSAATLNGGYAVSLRGGTKGTLTIPTFASAVGRFDASGGNVSNGELGRGFDDTDFGDCGANITIAASPTPAYTPFSGSYGSVDASTGHAVFTLQNVNMGGGSLGSTETLSSMTLSAYVVSATEVLLVETDTGGYSFVGSAEQQSKSNFANGDFSGDYALLMQANNGAGTGNINWSPISTPAVIPNSGTVNGLTEGEYAGNLDGSVQYGLNYGGSYDSMVQTNGLGLATLCTGIYNSRLAMYFVSPQEAFIWNPNSSTTIPAKTILSDEIGEIDLRQGGPFGGQGQAMIDGTYAFGFEGMTGTFNGSHTASGVVAESGRVTLTTTGTIQLAPGDVEQTGTAVFVIDEADSSGTTASPMTINATFTFNDDMDGDNNALEFEGFGSISFSAPPPFPVPDRFVVVSGNKIHFLHLGTDSNIGGSIEKQ
jgi:hypothetical protein